MSTCPHCGQSDIDESHQCAAPVAVDELVTGVRGASIALALLILSFALFAAVMTFTVLHQQMPASPVIIQTTLPTNAATDIPTEQGIAPSPTLGVVTTTPSAHGSGGKGGPSQHTPTPAVLPSATPLPPPTAAPPTLTPTDTPQPTPTRSPQ